MATEETAYQRLQQAVAKANVGAGLLAMQTVRAIHHECLTLDVELLGESTGEADAARAVIRRIRVHLSMAVDQPEEQQ